MSIEKMKNAKLRLLAERLEDGKADTAQIFSRLTSRYVLPSKEIGRARPFSSTLLSSPALFIKGLNIIKLYRPASHERHS